MITYRELGKQARVFKSLTGVTVGECDELYGKVQPITVNERGRIRDVSTSTPGRVHDLENTICELKHSRALFERFRHVVDRYDVTFRAVVAIVNPRIARRVAAVT